MPSPRRKQLRDALLGSLGRFVDEIDRVLDGHVDQGRPVPEEAQDVSRQVLEILARRDLADKILIFDSDTFELPRRRRDEDTTEMQRADWPDMPKTARDASDEGEVGDSTEHLAEELRKLQESSDEDSLESGLDWIRGDDEEEGECPSRDSET